MKNFFKLPSIKLYTFVMVVIVALLIVSLGVLFYFTRKVLVEEVKMDAEQRLEGTVQRVDNVLLAIEQATGNVYRALLEDLDHPDHMINYCRRIVECNENIKLCAIAFEPNYYPDKELFFNFVYREKQNSSELTISDDPNSSTPYTQQYWYRKTMETGHPSWLDPGENDNPNLEPIIHYCLPITNQNSECVGVITVGLYLNLLSQIVLEANPSANSYNVLLSDDGSYLIHPNREKLRGQTVFDNQEILESPTALAAAKAMVQGETGDVSFEMNDYNWHLFYKPFVLTSMPGRYMKSLNWSIAMVYPYEDIFGEYNHLVYHVLGIVLVALLVFFLLCKRTINKQIKPLVYLTESAERIADGHYDESFPNVNRDDEVGVFYHHFQLMHKALVDDITKQEEQEVTMSKHHEALEKRYQQIHDDEQVKARFLHNVTNNMIAPAQSIDDSAKALCDHYGDITLTEANKIKANIHQQSETIIELLGHYFNVSSNKAGKENNHG